MLIIITIIIIIIIMKAMEPHQDREMLRHQRGQFQMWR